MHIVLSEYCETNTIFCWHLQLVAFMLIQWLYQHQKQFPHQPFITQSRNSLLLNIYMKSSLQIRFEFELYWISNTTRYVCFLKCSVLSIIIYHLSEPKVPDELPGCSVLCCVCVSVFCCSSSSQSCANVSSQPITHFTQTDMQVMFDDLVSFLISMKNKNVYHISCLLHPFSL